MTIQLLNGSQIQNITKERLVYVDNNSTEQYIDFETCYRNYVQQSLSPETWETIKDSNKKSDADWENYKETIQRFKYIGDRNVLTPPWADGPYIEFYTTPTIRFKFATEQEFQKVRYFIEKYGWRTGDRS